MQLKVSGLKILRGIVSGERDIKKLASYRDKNCKNNITIIEKSLVGNYRQEHVFALTQILELYDVYHAKLAICDAEIEKVLIKLNTFDINTIKIASKANGKSRRKNEMHFNVRNELIKMVGVDITQIDGINSYSAFKIISEIGTNMSRWPTVKHFVSWLGLAPGTKISGGKIISSATKTCTNRVADVLRVAAQTLTRSHSALGSFFRRKRAQLGSPKAITATAHKLAKIIYLMLKHKTDYIDLGEHYYEKKYKESIVKNLITRAKKLGLEIVKPSDMHELVSVNR